MFLRLILLSILFYYSHLLREYLRIQLINTLYSFYSQSNYKYLLILNFFDTLDMDTTKNPTCMKNKTALKGRILIVEDDMLLSLVEERLILKLGYSIAGKAVSGDEAIQKTKDLDPDLILMDISLRGQMDGVETMKMIRKFSNVPVIYLSGNPDKLSVERAKKTNFVDYLIKPVSESDLNIPIARALKNTGKTTFSHAV